MSSIGTGAVQANAYIQNVAGSFVPQPNANVGDAVSGSTLPAEAGWGQSGSTSATNPIFSAVRIANIIKTSPLITTVAATTIWTPSASRRFRLMGYRITLSANAAQAVAGIVTLTFNDNVTAIGLSEDIFVPSAAGTTIGLFSTPWTMLGNGYLSTTQANTLNVTLNTAITTGGARVICIGTEEF